jgi:hypothetical protein
MWRNPDFWAAQFLAAQVKSMERHCARRLVQ